MAEFKDIFEQLRLRPSLKHMLLEECWGRLTGTEVALRILGEFGRPDVKVCIQEQDYYSPTINTVSLSEDVADSCSVLAAAIAAHEIGHAFQLEVIGNLRRFLKKLSIFWLLSSWGELFMLILLLLKIVPHIVPYFVSSVESQFQNQGSQEFEEQKFQQDPKSNRFIYLPHLVQLAITLLLWAAAVLLFPIKFLSVVISWFGLVILVALILVALSIGCALICRCLIFLIEIHASVIALHLLKQCKILSIQQQKTARHFLLACASTYLRSCSLNRVFT